MGKMKLVGLRCEYEINPLGIHRTNPLFSWKVETEERNSYQSAYQIVAAASMEMLAVGEYDVWNSGRIASGENTGIEYAGKELTSAQRVYWKVRVWNSEGEVSDYSDPAWFETGLLKTEDWKGVWMSFLGGMIGNGILMRYYFEGQKKKIARARAYVCCTGYYELRLNGKKIGDKLLDPAPTDYSKTLLYSTYDVTEALNEDANTIGFVLGTGWAGLPKVLLQLNIEYEDGTVQEEYTDWGIGWCVARGPITYNSIYDGEDYDARLEKDGWDTPEYQPVFLREHQRPEGWILATVVEKPSGTMVSEILPPVRIQSQIAPELLGHTPSGRLLYDTGKNLTGWVRVKVAGEAGAKVHLSFAEILDGQGELDKTALRLARCEDHYILRGDKDLEEYAPRFTYHGFRYFTVETEGDVEVKDLTVEFLHTDLKKNATFRSDNDLLNQLAEVMKHTDVCNMMGIPTDCAQRDERHGWATDTTSRAEGSMYHFDMASFFEKWTRDIYDTQDEKGYFADTAPFRWGRRPCDPQVNTPISLVLLQYQMYGNKRLMEETYDAMLRYLNVLLREADHYLISRTGFGEWACPKEFCYPEEFGAGAAPKHVTPTFVSTAYLYRSVRQIYTIASILGKQETAYLDALSDTIYERFNQRFYHAEGSQYDMGSQSANSLAVDMGLVQTENIMSVVKNINEDVMRRHYRVSTGNMGTKAMVEVLCRYGEEDTAYEIMTGTEAPSFGYMIKNGATSIWERWEADTDNNIMNSRNQPMLAAVCVWFYKYLGGIRPVRSKDGLEKLYIEPVIPQKLNRVEVEMDICNGHVKSSWERQGDKLVLRISVPFNTETRIILRSKYGQVKEATQNGQKLQVSETSDRNKTIYQGGNGDYYFVLQ